MAYSVDLRQQVLSCYESGEHTQEDVADLFEIGVASLKRWLSRKRKGEDLGTRTKNSGRKNKINDTGLETIKELIKNNPSITLGELSEMYFKKHKVSVGNSILSRALKKLNLRYKKLSVQAVEKESDLIKKKRRIFVRNKRCAN